AVRPPPLDWGYGLASQSRLFLVSLVKAKKDPEPISRDPERVQTRQIALPPHLDDPDLPHDRVALGPLTQDNEAVGHREDGMVLGFRSWKLPEEEGRRLAGREVKRQPLDEVLDFRRHLPVVDSQHRAERVDHDPSRSEERRVGNAW